MSTQQLHCPLSHGKEADACSSGQMNREFSIRDTSPSTDEGVQTTTAEVRRRLSTVCTWMICISVLRTVEVNAQKEPTDGPRHGVLLFVESRRASRATTARRPSADRRLWYFKPLMRLRVKVTHTAQYADPLLDAQVTFEQLYSPFFDWRLETARLKMDLTRVLENVSPNITSSRRRRRPSVCPVPKIDRYFVRRAACRQATNGWIARCTSTWISLTYVGSSSMHSGSYVSVEPDPPRARIRSSGVVLWPTL